MNTTEIKDLIEKYNSQTATTEEKKLVEEWYERIDGAELTLNQSEDIEVKEQILSRVTSRIQKSAKPKRVRLNDVWPFKAAVILVAFMAGTYIYFKQNSRPQVSSTIAKINKKPIVPGGNNAVLLLADGSQIILNKTSDGQVANQSGVEVIKTKSGELLYRFTGNSTAEAAAINTVSTPRGGQYHLILVDGTEVWLNASSSVRFPTAFVGKERKVEVTGEAYFEVAKNKTKPFIVHTNQSDIQVLGTHFNVNAYADEEYQRTTLLEGSIEIKQGNKKALLKPGQQASLNLKTAGIKVNEIADLEAVVAWKNGYFQFDRSDLPSVMRQVSRWYDAEVIYNGKIPAKQYSGKIPRNVSVVKLVEMLAYSGIHCKIENNQITVNPK
ncbi:FecR family protein [Pedobacter zeae]|uniref:Ferric-dicitrate binding protein FerR (Iron transport regulator) n=1 Tax=Pedobacter zeae TaxID=1737356 RepID=A0A7W6K8K5_9SPHI|nr:FecR family protein [Pedobacter zeae]MBB4107110.1 ferric-dicitrate binding protein FerR (iron transport regulator) [Pedobacter zeae]GGH05802.1 iron dicitrate transporter FecR [Pedobacter zeae]